MILHSQKKNVITEVIALLFIVLFIYASVSKLTEYDKFVAQLGQSPMFASLAPLVAVVVPAAEIIIALLLAIPRLRLAGMFAAFTLMVLFTAYIIIITQYADFIPCSCGGVLQKLGWDEHLIFNCVFVVLAVAGVFLCERPTESNNESTCESSIPSTLL